MRRVKGIVRRSKVYEETLQTLGGAGTDKMFRTLRDALAFAAVLGYKERNKLPIDKSAGYEDIAGSQFDTNEAVDVLFAIGLADSKDSDILKENRETDCIHIFEEYANGGLSMIQNWLEKYGSTDVPDAIARGLSSIGIKPPSSEDAIKPITDPVF